MPEDFYHFWDLAKSLKPGNPRGMVLSLESHNDSTECIYARAEQLGQLGLPGCDEALSGNWEVLC